MKGKTGLTRQDRKNQLGEEKTATMVRDVELKSNTINYYHFQFTNTAS